MAVSYSLTLTVAERQEIDFIGYRCPRVMELLDLLKARIRTFQDWEDDSDLTLYIDQQTMYAIDVLQEQDGFAWIKNRSLLNKLEKLCVEVACPC